MPPLEQIEESAVRRRETAELLRLAQANTGLDRASLAHCVFGLPEGALTDT